MEDTTLEKAQKAVIEAAIPILEEGFDDIVVIARSTGQHKPMIYIKGKDGLDNAGMCLWAAGEIQTAVIEGELAQRR